MSWGEIHTNQHVGKNDQIAGEIVDFHEWLPVGHSSRNRKRFSNDKVDSARSRRFVLWPDQRVAISDKSNQYMNRRLSEIPTQRKARCAGHLRMCHFAR